MEDSQIRLSFANPLTVVITLKLMIFIHISVASVNKPLVLFVWSYLFCSLAKKNMYSVSCNVAMLNHIINSSWKI